MITNETAENLLHGLVSVQSPSYSEAEAVKYLVNWMTVHGYDHAYIDEAGNAVGIIGRGKRDVVLLGHIDTFGGFPDVRLEGRLLYGRGTVDAKGSLCTFAAAALRANLPEDVRVVVIGAVEEEAASSKGARYAATQFAPDWCIIGEPSNWDRITLGYKGRLVLSWSWQGGLAHSAGDTPTAPERAFAYWRRIVAFCEDFNTGRDTLFARLDSRLQAINSRDDGINGYAEMTVGFRLPPDLTPSVLFAAIGTDDNAEIRMYGAEQAVVSERDSTLTRVLRGGIRAGGGSPRFVHKTGTADMNVVAPIWKCPIVAYGPGDSALDHTPHEHIDLDEYLRAIDVLSHALSKLGNTSRDNMPEQTESHAL